MTSTSTRTARSGTSILAQTTATAIAPQTYQSLFPIPATDTPGTLTSPTYTAVPVPAFISSRAVGDFVFWPNQTDPITNGPWQIVNPATGELTRGHPNYGAGQTAYKGSRFVDQSTDTTYELQADSVVDTDPQDWQVVPEGLPLRVIYLDSTSPTYQILDGPGTTILMVDSSLGSPGDTTAVSAENGTVNVGAILPVNPSPTPLTAPTIVKVHDVANSFAANNFVLQYGAHLRNGVAIADGLQEMDGVNSAAILTYISAAVGFTPNEVWLKEGATPTATGGDIQERVTLTLLNPNTWTPTPAPSSIAVINDFEIINSVGELVTSDFDRRENPLGSQNFEIRSVIGASNLTIEYEGRP